MLTSVPIEEHNQSMEEPNRTTLQYIISEKNLNETDIEQDIINLLESNDNGHIDLRIIFSLVILAKSWAKIYSIFEKLIPYFVEHNITSDELFAPTNIYTKYTTSEDIIKSLLTTLYWNKVFQHNNTRTTFPLFCPKKVACQIIPVNKYDELYTLSATTVFTAKEGI